MTTTSVDASSDLARIKLRCAEWATQHPPTQALHPLPSQPSSNHSFLFLSVLYDPDFLKGNDSVALGGNGFDIATTTSQSSTTTSDPFHADWPHWGSPAPCWLERCL